MDKNHRHFKMSDESAHHIFNHSHKLAIFIAVFVTIILCAAVFIWLDSKQSDDLVVIPDETQKKVEPVDQVQLAEDYKKDVQQVLNNYLIQRKDESSDCRTVIDTTLENILNLVVPTDFKEFHLELVVLLDKENIACENYAQFDNLLDKDWDNILSSYDWLNE